MMVVVVENEETKGNLSRLSTPRTSERERERRGDCVAAETRLIDVPSTSSSRFYRSNYTASDPFERFVKEKFGSSSASLVSAEMEYHRFGSRVSHGKLSVLSG